MGGSAARVMRRLERLYAIGGGPGANRIGGTREEQEAHEVTAGWMEEAALEVEVDRDGNLIGRLRGSRPELAEIWTGSHLDSVPRGGRFDGALGVVAGLEALERIGPQPRTLAVVAFRDEERGCAGSRGLVARGEPLPGAYLEAHVEQGPLLERRGAPLGVVTGIVAYARDTAVIEGRVGHAGTTPMDARADALCAAAELVLAIRDAAGAIDGAVATVGRLEVEPGAANVVPGRVRLTLDARAPDDDRLDALLAEIGRHVDVGSERTPAVAMGREPTAVLRGAVHDLGFPAVELVSGAGHDAGILAAAGVPAAMLFVRSLAGGVSHSPEEETSAEDIADCVDALAETLARLARMA
jgi:N-carbamoyl-L-amino-acid hydrolase